MMYNLPAGFNRLPHGVSIQNGAALGGRAGPLPPASPAPRLTTACCSFC